LWKISATFDIMLDLHKKNAAINCGKSKRLVQNLQRLYRISGTPYFIKSIV